MMTSAQLNMVGARHALEQWGLWCRTKSPGPKPQKSWMGAFIDRLKERSAMPGITIQTWGEEDGEIFDYHVMRKIKKSNPDVFQALKLYYAYIPGDDALITSKKHLAKRLSVDWRTAAKLLEVGEGMVAVLLCE